MKNLLSITLLLVGLTGCDSLTKEEIIASDVRAAQYHNSNDAEIVEKFKLTIDRCIYSTRNGGIPYEIGLSPPPEDGYGIPHETYGYKIIIKYHGKTQVGFCELDDIDATILRLQKKLYWSDNDDDAIIEKYQSKTYTTKDLQK